MEPRIEKLTEKKIVGKRITTSFSINRTKELWQSFMPNRKEIKNNVSLKLHSIEVYPESHFVNFNPKNEFEKWAGVEVTDFHSVPADMETITIPSGLYVVFIHKGPASNGHKTYQYIFADWLPKSEYLLENRPHFAVMGEKYKHEDPTSEEEIWIPIKQKN
ncbi:GyrI-like domain-containing protein [Flavobacterium branchiarum]|uniref:GyrI-like domain-containing protein n=1 Tax=Flavobacterium branchiarum TaxID=1114870 RepID=A0ABV5FKN3_9FLAO|nr:GyrI-like domain-containing protein [Flavobacterium branchiarum]MDN3672261.1 GyrI-like domain-containing protein [Flavobacterium branchiarum]